MAELLTVIALIAILLALGIISIVGYQKDLQLTQNNSAAKEIYLAAQNNIADLEASGEWDINKDGVFTPSTTVPASARTDDDGKTQDDGYTYYYITASIARTCGILPAGTIEDTVWSGSYVIEYCYETGMVYGVFYTPDDGKAEAYYANGLSTAPATFRSHDSRRGNDPVIGYYGGASADNLENATLAAPAVKMIGTTVTVCDPNLDSHGPASASANWRTYQMLTIVGKTSGESLIVRLSATDVHTPSVEVYRKTSGGYAKVALTDTSFCTLTAEQGSVNYDTYSIDLGVLKNAIESTAGQSTLAFSAGETIDLKSRCSSNALICRSTYGYAQGLWQTASVDLVFTSNVMDDWSTAAVVDAYVNENNKLTSQNGSQGNGNTKGNQVELQFSNFYDSDTASDNLLCYRIGITRNGGATSDATISSVTTVQDSKKNAISPQNGYYLFSALKQTHYATIEFGSDVFGDSFANDQNLDYRSYLVTVTACKVTGGAPDTSATKTLTIELRVHKSDTANYYYVEDSVGSNYATLHILSGSGMTPTVTWDSEALVIDATSPSVPSDNRANTGTKTLNAIGAEGSVAVKFLKLNPSADYSNGSASDLRVTTGTVSIG